MARLDDCSDRLASISIARGVAIRKRERGLEMEILNRFGFTERAAASALSGGPLARAQMLDRIAVDVRAEGAIVAREMVGCGRLEERAFREAVERVSGRGWVAVPDELIAVADRMETFQGMTVRQWAHRIAVRTRSAVREVYRQVDAGNIRGPLAREALSAALGVGRRGLAFLAGTFCYRATAYARELSFRLNQSDLRGVVWLSVLDDRTTPHICLPRAWKRYSLPNLLPIGHDRPWLEGPGRSHVRCRARSSVALNGCRWPRSLSGELWLREQSREVQEEILGVGRVKLWRSKTHTLNQMIETDHHALRSLGELEGFDLRIAGLL